MKTDRRDAEGIARVLHLGWFGPVHCNSVSAQEVLAALGARKAVQQSMIALELSLRGLACGKSWPAWSAVSATSPKTISPVVGGCLCSGSHPLSLRIGCACPVVGAKNCKKGQASARHGRAQFCLSPAQQAVERFGLRAQIQTCTTVRSKLMPGHLLCGGGAPHDGFSDPTRPIFQSLPLLKKGPLRRHRRETGHR